MKVEEVFVWFYNMIEAQSQTIIRILHFDNSTEYFNEQLTYFLQDKGTSSYMLRYFLAK